MGKLAEAKTLPEAAYDMDGTLKTVRFLMDQLRAIERPPLKTVKVPSGGGLAFEIPNGTDEPDLEKSIEGIIVYYHAANAYWPNAFSGGREDPACSSGDGVSGWDADGMESNCRNCPRNRMGSAADGRGKACKNMTRVLILPEGESLPISLVLPPMSLGNFSAYMADLAPMRLTVHDVVTKVTLAKAANKAGISYSRAQFQAVGRVEQAQIALLKRSMAPVLLPESAERYAVDMDTGNLMEATAYEQG